MKTSSKSRSQKTNTSRKADRETEIINVPMPRNVAQRLAVQSFTLVDDFCRPNRKGTDEDTIAGAIDYTKGSDDEENTNNAIEEYRILTKALAAEVPTGLTLEVDGFKIELTPDCAKRLEAEAASSKMTPGEKFQDIACTIALSKIV